MRVDCVLIRNLDTRIYYVFWDKYIIRNVSVKEMSYGKLKNIGFSFRNDWN